MGLSAAVYQRKQLESLAVYEPYAESLRPFAVHAVLGNLVLVGASAVDNLEIIVLRVPVRVPY